MYKNRLLKDAIELHLIYDSSQLIHDWMCHHNFFLRD